VDFFTAKSTVCGNHPFRLFNPFSILLAQAAQDMPLMGNVTFFNCLLSAASIKAFTSMSA